MAINSLVYYNSQQLIMQLNKALHVEYKHNGLFTVLIGSNMTNYVTYVGMPDFIYNWCLRAFCNDQ